MYGPFVLLVLLLAVLVSFWMMSRFWNSDLIIMVSRSSSSSFPSEIPFQSHLHRIININYRQIWEKLDLYSPSTFSAYKWMIVFEGGQQVLFKPALINKTVKTRVNCVSGCGHPKYEIAGFALNSLFGLQNMPYTTGRRVSWDQEIAPVATEVLKKSVTFSNLFQNLFSILISFLIHICLVDGDICIVWTCYLEYESRYCFEKGIIYGALVYWIGNKTVVQRVADKASYDIISFEYILDMDAIDFLMLNYDGGKHIYIANRNDTIHLNILTDYGSSFCDRNDPILLAPIYQCSRIRKNLYKSLMKYSVNLTEAFDEATNDDPLYPLLLPMDLTGMQQRLNTIITIIEICFKKYGEMGVLI
ncbi:hypothetical protein ACJMK2_043218 [Sinanodonta woodiana]|uniref:FAM20 C-terminal domain-containing protein n=1 Tax=Sinanodonta woodiana TaxID=1069815 RepID=A0ABD3VW85_SINWO